MIFGPTDRRAKSPLAAAIAISLGIAAGVVLSTLDAPIFDELTSGSWLTELATSHKGAVAAITRRLDRLEVLAGISTDVISSNHRVRKRHSIAQNLGQNPESPQILASPEQAGHIFNIKPVSQQAPPL